MPNNLIANNLVLQIATLTARLKPLALSITLALMTLLSGCQVFQIGESPIPVTVSASPHTH